MHDMAGLMAQRPLKPPAVLGLVFVVEQNKHGGHGGHIWVPVLIGKRKSIVSGARFTQ
jgi:hypothetical protein